MDVGDWIFIAQTLILFLTGIVVLVYTCETRRLRKAAERGHLIAAKSALLAGYLQYLSVLEARNNFLQSKGSNAGIHTGDLKSQIGEIENELKALMSNSA